MTLRIAAVCVALVAVAAGGGDDARLERMIEPAGAGANRLEVDAALLASSNPLRYDGSRFTGGLHDLRIYRGSIEVPYLLIAPVGSEAQWISGSVLPVQPTKEESGFELDLGEVRVVDALRLPDLRAPFLKRFRLEGSGDRERWTLLEGEGTLFDLPSENLALREVAFEPGEYRYLRVTWDDRSSGRVSLPRSPEARLATRASSEPARYRVNVEKRPSEPGTSRYHLTLPADDLPARAIVLESEEETLSRPATIHEIRYARGEALPVELGESLLRKVERDGATASDLRIAIDEPDGPELELVIDDGDNPPFRLESAFVELPPLPWIYFETDSAAPLVARFGDEDAEAPRYDLEAKRDGIVLSRVPVAEWGALSSAASTTASSEFPSFGGAPIDRDSFHWMKPVPKSPAGLTSLLVDAEALAHSNGLADIRIVTGEGTQVPYLVERRDEPMEIALTVGERREIQDGRSRYEIALPWSTVPRGTRLMLETESRVFHRELELISANESRNRSTLATALWTHSGIDRPARPLVLDPPLSGHETIALLVDEGDNAPLEISAATLLVPSVRLRFIRDDDSPLELLYGAPSMKAPRYDIDMLAPHLFGRRAREIEAGPAQPLRDIPSEDTQRHWFWIVVAASAIVLFLVIARVLKGS